MKKLVKFLTAALAGTVIIGCGGGSNSTPASGSLDKSFGDNGKVIHGKTSNDQINDIISNSDGTIYACGTISNDSFLSKYSENGDLISSFGTDGIAFSHIPKFDTCKAIAKDSNNNIYAVGYFIDSSNKRKGYVLKYNHIGGIVYSLNFPQDSFLNAVAIQKDGKILVAGQKQQKAYLFRFDSSGATDTAFGTNGEVAIGSGYNGDEIRDIAIDSYGRIIIAGKRVAGVNNENAVVARLTKNGQLDTTFGTNGVAIYDGPSHKADRAEAVKIDSSGKIVVTGYSDEKMALAKFNNDGSLDTSFASNGLFIYSNGVNSAGIDLTIDANDNILVTGSVPVTQMALWRFDTTGKLDTSFNNTGIATFTNGYNWDVGRAIALDKDYKILVGGFSNQGNVNHADATIWRINP